MTREIVYTAHALTAMRERDVPKEWVERTVLQPDWTEPDPRDPAAVRYFRSIVECEGRHLRVVLVQTDQNTRILTAFLDRGARPK
ncbi:DUF4258 domain-containing protein [Devosia riboflavina]|uniref:DUF4258 domain-containing protein n=1 Tax=Devosia riboflavina TaxID=46914 RepID=UPI001269A6C3